VHGSDAVNTAVLFCCRKLVAGSGTSFDIIVLMAQTASSSTSGSNAGKDTQHILANLLDKGCFTPQQKLQFPGQQISWVND